MAVEMIGHLRFGKYYITSGSISAESGLFIQKCRIIARRKIGFVSIARICPAERPDILITDGDVSEEYGLEKYAPEEYASEEDKKVWKNPIHNAMSQNFSWEESAQKYIWLYEDEMK